MLDWEPEYHSPAPCTLRSRLLHPLATELTDTGSTRQAFWQLSSVTKRHYHLYSPADKHDAMCTTTLLIDRNRDAEADTHWPRASDARHVGNVRNRQHNTQRRYLLHLALIVLYRVLFFPILTSSNIPSRRACPRSPPLIIFLGPAECTTAHCPHRGCTLFIIHFDEYFDL